MYCIGNNSGIKCSENNVCVGNNTLAASGADGSNLVLLGSHAGYGNSGNYNILCGTNTGKNNVGDNNVILGHLSGENNKGSNNVLLGHDIHVDGSNKLVIHSKCDSKNLIEGDFLTGQVSISSALVTGEITCDRMNINSFSQPHGLHETLGISDSITFTDDIRIQNKTGGILVNGSNVSLGGTIQTNARNVVILGNSIQHQTDDKLVLHSSEHDPGEGNYLVEGHFSQGIVSISNMLVTDTIKTGELSVNYIHAAGNIIANDLAVWDITGKNVNVNDIDAQNITVNDISGRNITGKDVKVHNISASDIYVADITGKTLQVADITGGDINAGNITGKDLQVGDITGGNITGKRPSSDRHNWWEYHR